MYLTGFRTYKITLSPQTKNLGGEGASDRKTPAAQSLDRSMVKKSRHLGVESIKLQYMVGRVSLPATAPFYSTAGRFGPEFSRLSQLTLKKSLNQL